MSNVQMMRDLYEAFGRGDIPTVLGAMDPDIEWREAEVTHTSRAALHGGGRTPSCRTCS